jgi:nucleotide-binding universal stress UspA family protein
MKKILAAFDGLKYSQNTRDYVIHIAKQTHAHIVGVFLDDRTYTSYKVYDLIVEQGSTEAMLEEYEQKDKETRREAASDFEKSCQNEGVEYSVHHDLNIAIQELKHESIYTDLLVIDAKETLTHYTEKLPTRFIRDLLIDVQSPVFIVQGKFKPIKKIILLYDGEPSSVHAIKMFSYLLPQMKHLETEVISVNPLNKTLHLPDNRLMKEFMKRHFPKASFTVLKGYAEEEIVKYLKQQKQNSLVVLGAYRRSTVSRWFRESMADILMKKTKLPLFIAHNK